MIPSAVVFAYLGIVLYIGIFAFRHTRDREAAEGFFLANRSLGAFVFLFSLFGTHMTAFSILGASGHAFHNGIVTYGLMASSSALVMPLALLFVGTRLWAVGKRHGFITPVQMFRDRWECNHIGTVIFAVQAALLIPYIVIGVKGGGETLAAISGGLVPYWFGGAIVALVVMSYVFFGGMRGTAWVNTFQTILFLIFGTIAVGVIGAQMGGFAQTMEALQQSPATAALLTRERISPLYFFSYTFIPLSGIAFPHICIFAMTARRVTHFKRTVILYPLCLLLIWLPSVFLGVAANRAAADIPEIQAKVEARSLLAREGARMTPPERDVLREQMQADEIVLLLLGEYAPVWLAGLLGAGIMAAVMASDSQILALSTMFTEDVFAWYGHKERFGEAVQVNTGRAFVILITLAAYFLALQAPQSIFELAVQYGFSGFAALSPLLVAALYWRGSTRWGALAVTLWVVLAMTGVAVFQWLVPAPAPGQVEVVLPWKLFGQAALARTPGGTSVFGFMPVVPMVLISALLMFVVSRFTPKPSAATIARYFPAEQRESGAGAAGA
jgi:SSS family solute:Na+ symporter